MVGPHSSHADVPADAQFLGTWHRAQGDFNLLHVGTAPGHGKPESSPTSPPDTHTCRLATSQGLHRFPGLHRLGKGCGQAWQLLPGPLTPVIRKEAKASFSTRPSSLSALRPRHTHFFFLEVARGRKFPS